MPKSHRSKRKINKAMEAYRITRRLRKLKIARNLRVLDED